MIDFTIAHGKPPTPGMMLLIYGMYVWGVLALAFGVWCIMKGIRSKKR